jgi:hypothetical protein
MNTRAHGAGHETLPKLDVDAAAEQAKSSGSARSCRNAVLEILNSA